MKAGAVDFIEKPYDDEALLSAIEAALARTGRADPDGEAAEARQRIAALSPRERQVLDALVAGRPNKVIAFDLGISVRTVEVHRARMMQRLGVAPIGRDNTPRGDGAIAELVATLAATPAKTAPYAGAD